MTYHTNFSSEICVSGAKFRSFVPIIVVALLLASSGSPPFYHPFGAFSTDWFVSCDNKDVFLVHYSGLGVTTFFPPKIPAHIIREVFQSGSEIVSPLAAMIAFIRVIPTTLGTAKV
jgi:hypothetical protein